MPSTSTSTTNSTVGATNPMLNNLFTNLFGSQGNLGTSAVNTLTGVMNGSTMANNTASLYKTLSTASAPQYQQGMATIQNQMATAGLTNSSSLGGATGSYTAQYLGNLTNVATQMGLSETQMQSGVAGNLMGMLASAGSQYYTNSSTTNASSMNWSQAFNTGMGGIMDVAGAGGFQSLAQTLFT